MTRLADLQAQRAGLLEQLRLAEVRAHQQARIMYRRGYLAGHSAGRKNARRVKGPYGKTRSVIDA